LRGSKNRRVVITGLGAVTPIGNNIADAWAAATEGKSGIATITKFDASAFSTRFAGEVKGFNIEDYISAKEAPTWIPSSITAWQLASRLCRTPAWWSPKRTPTASA